MLVDESMNAQLVELALGESCEIRLAENRTAGYQWSLVADGTPICERVGDDYQTAAGPPGKGGTHWWELRAIHSGETRVLLEYRRSWEPDASPARTFSLRVRVSPAE
jgi:predicted secreted protein